MAESEKKKDNGKKRLYLLYALSFIATVAPLITVLIVKWGQYTKTPSETVKLCAGGLICLFFVFLKVIGKLRMPRRIVLFTTLFLMVYLLQTVLDDMLLLTGMAWIGEVIDAVLFQSAIKKEREKIAVEKTADATAEKVEALLKEYVGNGRT